MMRITCTSARSKIGKNGSRTHVKIFSCCTPESRCSYRKRCAFVISIFLVLTIFLAFQPQTRADIDGLPHGEQNTYLLSTPRVLIVSSSMAPFNYLSRIIFIDLFEYGIVPDVASTTKYLSIDRAGYDIIFFSGYSNPEDPTEIKKEAIIDVLSGRKVVFVGSEIFQKTNENGDVIKRDHGLKTVLGLPAEQEYWSPDLVVDLELSENDDFFKENKDMPPRMGLNYFDKIVREGENRTTGYIRNRENSIYFLLTNSKGAWISPKLSSWVHFGKVVAKLWWGSTSTRFGFSLDRKDGKQIFIWRVDADSCDEQGFVWLDNLSRTYKIKVSIGAIGKHIENDTKRASYWKVIDKNELFEIGVHSYYHGSYQTDLLWEVTETYKLLRSYGINASKIFLGWGTSSWNSSQLESLYQSGWTIVHSSYSTSRSGKLDDCERFGISFSDIAATGDLLETKPVPLGHTSLSDYNAKIQNLNFTRVNILCFQEARFRMLPFILLTHDYSWRVDYSNEFGSLKSQIESFIAWARNEQIKPMWISEYYLIYHDAHRGNIVMDGNIITVTRPNAQANDVKIYVGTNSMYAKGDSIVNQRILNGWLYISLRPEKTSKITLTHLEEASAALAMKLYEGWEKVDAALEDRLESKKARDLVQKAMQQYQAALNEFNNDRYDDVTKYLSELTESLEQAFLAEKAYQRQVRMRPLILILVTTIAGGLAILLQLYHMRRCGY